jgi:CxxC motif-containing protein (DUF1111 family)
MPLPRPVRATLRLPRRQYALAPPGGRLFGVALVALGLSLLAVATAPMLAGAQSAASGARDPGPRGGSPDAGGPLTGLSAGELAFFNSSQDTFQEVDDVADGLGPRFNMDSCAGCHAFPAVGGSSPTQNPQVGVATKNGADNTLPSFIKIDGPIREARFVRNSDGSPDGGVHDLFTIAGRSDASTGCTISQPNFASQLRNNNVSFRIPTPTYGNGLIAGIPDSAIIANKHADPTGNKGKWGITGHENREGNAGTITRFGWKAQNKSLEIFAGEAYLVEQGVTSEVFTQERGEPGDNGVSERTEPPAACLTNGLPEDLTHFGSATNTDVPSDVVQFATFMRFLAAPTPQRLNASTRNGQTLFNQIGCALCHTPSLQTGQSSTDALSNKSAQLYSDLLVHNMGPGLADGVSQGGAGPDEFRTAPLWGLGQRIFFLHDGRTKDLVQAIQAHASSANRSYPASEANRVVANYNNLGQFAQQDLLNFLRSL